MTRIVPQTKCVFVYVGLDDHEASVRVCVLAEDGRTLVNRDVANDPGTVRDLVQQYGWPKGMAIEACCGAADFAARRTRQTEWSVKLAHPGYVRRLKPSPDKSDHDDAALLADLVRVNYLPEVWLADEETRRLRRLVKYRQQVLPARKNVKQQVRSLLKEERVQNAPANPWTKAWLEWLKTTPQLAGPARWIIDQQLQQRDELNRRLQEIEAKLKELTADDPLTQRLQEQAGVGPITAVTLRSEIGTIARFRTGKQLARYCGITPCNASSGRRQADAGLVKAGSPELRGVLLEAAHRLSRLDPKWKALKERLRRSKPGNVATAAVANRWVRWLFHRLRGLDPALGPVR